MTANEYLEIWRTNQATHEFLLELIPDAGLKATLSTRGGRDVARQIAHLHTNRVRWLTRRGAADLCKGVPEFESKHSPSRKELLLAMRASSAAMERYITEVASGERKLRQQKKGLAVSMAYFVSHESHHRGSILLTLKQCKHKVDRRMLDGIWDWHRR